MLVNQLQLFLDDLETRREGVGEAGYEKSKPAIEPPYRWRDWATTYLTAISNDELRFLHQP